MPDFCSFFLLANAIHDASNSPTKAARGTKGSTGQKDWIERAEYRIARDVRIVFDGLFMDSNLWGAVIDPPRLDGCVQSRVDKGLLLLIGRSLSKSRLFTSFPLNFLLG